MFKRKFSFLFILNILAAVFSCDLHAAFWDPSDLNTFEGKKKEALKKVACVDYDEIPNSLLNNIKPSNWRELNPPAGKQNLAIGNGFNKRLVYFGLLVGASIIVYGTYRYYNYYKRVHCNAQGDDDGFVRRQ